MVAYGEVTMLLSNELLEGPANLQASAEALKLAQKRDALQTHVASRPDPETLREKKILH